MKTKSQLWILSTGGGEAERLTQEKGSVDDFVWSPDSSVLCSSFMILIRANRKRKKRKEKKTVPPLVIDRFQFKQDIDGYLTDRYSHLKLLDLATRKLDPLTTENTTIFCPPGPPMATRLRL